jgi:hypothetical protein
MSRRVILLSAFIAFALSSVRFASAQSFVGDPSIVRNSISSTKVVDSTGVPIIAIGDLIIVTVAQPANNATIYVSVHVEFFDETRKQWLRVPAAPNEFQATYRSAKYGDLRDYFYISQSSTNVSRKIAFFLPYKAFGLTEGSHTLRYTLRLWDEKNTEIQRAVATTDSTRLHFTRSSVHYVIVQMHSYQETVIGPDGLPRTVVKEKSEERLVAPPTSETLRILDPAIKE